MKLENKFIIETLKALTKGSRIGKEHYSVTISQTCLLNLINKLEHELK